MKKTHETETQRADGASYNVEPATGCDHVADAIVDIRYIITGLLDADVMLDGLYDLIEQKWPQAGARIHKKPNGLLEMQVPNIFDDASPPVLFDVYDADEDTPLSSCFNRLPDGYQRKTGMMCFDEVLTAKPAATALLTLRNPTSPRGKRCASATFGPLRLSLDQITRSGAPMLTAELYRFPHGGETIVRVLFPHVWDAGALADFMRAWTSAVNNDHMNSIPEVLPLRHAPRHLLSFDAEASSSDDDDDGEKAPKPRQPRKRVPPNYYPKTALNTFIIVVCLLWRNVLLRLMYMLKPRRMRSVQVWIPQKQLDAWRSEAMMERPADLISSPDSDMFLSDNDLITSWLVWLSSQSRRSWLYGMYSIQLPVNMRTVDARTRQALQIRSKPTASSSKATAIRGAGKVLLHNWLSVITMAGQWCHVSRGSKWRTAWALRQTVNTASRTPAGVRSLGHRLAVQNNMSFDGESRSLNFRGGIGLAVPPSHEIVIVTNWTQSDFMSAANFERAVIPGTAPQGALVGAPSQMVGLGQPEEMMERSKIFPMAAVYYKRPKEGLLTTITIDAEFIEKGLLGEMVAPEPGKVV